ncbi:MAG: peptidoglycan D,D-transpeptidase FtsI family protein [Luteolibacter sp.]|jgi:penicillin-binding protein 2
MESTSYRFRIYLLTILVLGGFGMLLHRLYEYQIERRDEFQRLVPGNRTVTVREPGIRGEITDRNGITLARNTRSYEVTFNLEEIQRAYTTQHRETPTLERLVTRDGMTRLAPPERDIVTIVNNWTIRRLDELGLARDYSARALRTHFLTHGGLVPFTYRSDLTYEEFAKFAEHNLDLPGVDLTIRPNREYPYGSLASHAIGSLTQWARGDVPEAARREFDHYVGDDRGMGGIEATMDEILRGPEGRRSIIRDEKGQTIGMYDYVKPGVGARVQLTIDARVQYLVENVLRRTGRAAAVVMDVNTGEILALASVPDYDPNAFIPSISRARWEGYNARKDLAPLTNRALSAYEPGSTMKIPVSIAGAINGMANRPISCEGLVTYGNTPVRCWILRQSGGRHGTLTLPRAIQQSCNPYFNKLANTIGWRATVETCQTLGFGRRTGIELPNESPGLLPGSRAWRSTRPNAVMTPHATAMLSIGQGEMMATPLQMAALAATVANGGKYYQPRIVRQAVAENGQTVIANKPKLEVDLIEAGVSPADFELIRRGMFMAANEVGGTARRAAIPNYKIAAKTGTTQTTDMGRQSNNSWMISFAPFEEPKYAIAMIVQGGGSGGAVCGPLTQLIYRGLIARDEGMRLPLRQQTEFTGNTNRIDAIELPTDILAAIDISEEEEAAGETGEEAVVLVRPQLPEISTPVTPIPTITPEVDDEGTIPRAIPVLDN